jgi:hypothetical protein
MRATSSHPALSNHPSNPTDRARRSARAAALVAALSIGLAGCADTMHSASASPDAATTSAEPPPSVLGAQPFLADTDDQRWVDPSSTKLGDTLQVHAKLLTEGGVQLGTEAFTCTVVGVGPADDDLECDGTLVTADGSVQDAGLVPLMSLELPGADIEVPIVGGTGAYAGVIGVEHWHINRLGEAQGTIELR